jgi:hypothetical protein
MALPGVSFSETKDFDVSAVQPLHVKFSKRSLGRSMCYKADCCEAGGSPIAVADEANCLTILCNVADMLAKKALDILFPCAIG